MTTSTLPGPAPALADALRAAGTDLYLVGGFVRDRLLGRPTRDVDVSVAGDPRAAANRIARALGGSAFPLSESHGAWRVTLDAPIGGIDQVDVAAMRGDIEADLGARDFTINAIAVRPDGSDLRDPLGGVADLHAGVLRLVSADAIKDDPIRSLRAVRHVAELGFALDERAEARIRADAALLASAAGERQRDELMRAFETDQGAASVRLMDRLGLLDVMIPELIPAKGCVQPKEHYWDVFDHSVETVAVLDCLLAPGSPGGDCGRRRVVLDAAWPSGMMAHWNEQVGEGRTRRAVLKLVGLLHDVSKPETRTIQPNGKMRFFGHPERGAAVAEAVFRRLRFSAREIKLAERLIKDHLRPGQLAPAGEPPTARALFRLFRDLGDDVTDLLTLNLADGAAAAGPLQTAEDWHAHVAYTAWILRQREERTSLTKPRRLLSGHDLMAELGLAPGPELGQLLEALIEAEAAGEVTTREGALAVARRLLEEWET